MGEKDLEIEETSLARSEDERGNEAKTEVRKVKKKKKSLKEAVKAEKRGVCHVSRVPPRMDHVKLRQVLSQFGEIQRIYLVPEGFLSSLFMLIYLHCFSFGQHFQRYWLNTSLCSIFSPFLSLVFFTNLS